MVKQDGIEVGMYLYIVDIKEHMIDMPVEIAFCDYSFSFKTVQVTAISNTDHCMIQVLNGRTKVWMRITELYWTIKDVLIAVYQRRMEHLSRLKSKIKSLEDESKRKTVALPNWLKVGTPIRYRYSDAFDYTYDLIREIETRTLHNDEYRVEGYKKIFYIKLADIEADYTLSKYFEALTPEHFKSVNDFNIAMQMLEMIKLDKSNQYDIRKIFNKFLLKDGKPDED